MKPVAILDRKHKSTIKTLKLTFINLNPSRRPCSYPATWGVEGQQVRARGPVLCGANQRGDERGASDSFPRVQNTFSSSRAQAWSGGLARVSRSDARESGLARLERRRRCFACAGAWFPPFRAGRIRVPRRPGCRGNFRPVRFQKNRVTQTRPRENRDPGVCPDR